MLKSYYSFIFKKNVCSLLFYFILPENSVPILESLTKKANPSCTKIPSKLALSLPLKLFTLLLTSMLFSIGIISLFIADRNCPELILSISYILLDAHLGSRQNDFKQYKYLSILKNKYQSNATLYLDLQRLDVGLKCFFGK